MHKSSAIPSNNKKSIGTWLNRPVDPINLAVFRILFGLSLIYEILFLFKIGFVENFLLNGPSFKYDFFHFLEPMSEGMMNLVLVVLLICAIGITIGKFFKLSAVVFTLLFAYIFFLDRGYYNNHLYLFFLLTFLLSFSKANSALSLDKKARKIGQLPRYLLLIIQLQIVIVYFYGGIAKLNSD